MTWLAASAIDMKERGRNKIHRALLCAIAININTTVASLSHVESIYIHENQSHIFLKYSTIERERVITMHKTLVLIFLLVGGVASNSPSLKLRSNHIQLLSSNIVKSDPRGLDFCPECVNTFVELINIVLNILLDVGVVDTCNDLCDLVEQKSGSAFLGTLCGVTCDTLGIIEFVKLANKTDIDPIYYCEIISLCPSKFSDVLFFLLSSR